MKAAFNLDAALTDGADAAATAIVQWLWEEADEREFQARVDQLCYATVPMQDVKGEDRNLFEALKFTVSQYQSTGRARLDHGMLESEQEAGLFVPRLRALEHLHFILIQKSLDAASQNAFFQLEALWQYQKNCGEIEMPEIGAFFVGRAALCIEQLDSTDAIGMKMGHVLFCARLFLTKYPHVDERLRAKLEEVTLDFCDRSGDAGARAEFAALRIA